MATQNDSIFGDEIIHSYTRAQALEDGVLVDVSTTAREAGITFPLAVTARVWSDLVTPDPRAVAWGQSVEGRLWDLMSMLRFTIRASRGGGQVLYFRCIFVLKERQRRTVTLKAVCGPGDDAEPTITVMFPEED